MITTISAEDHSLEELYSRVFRSYDPFSPITTPNQPIRAVLFPTDSYHLTFEQFVALWSAVSSLSETNFYISEIEWQPDPFVRGNHYLCEQPTFDEYTKLQIGTENAIYSKSGKWGIMLSHELHAVLACDESFWRGFNKHYPHAEKDRSEFLDYWTQVQEHGVKIDWLPEFLSLLNKKG